MATNIIDYITGPEGSPSPVSSSSLSPIASPSPVTSPSPAASAPSSSGLWNGHLKPAEVQIIIIVLIAGLFNAFFLVLSLRLLWRRYQPGPVTATGPPVIAPPDVDLRRVTPMLVRQPDDELVYGLKQVLVQKEPPKPAS